MKETKYTIDFTKVNNYLEMHGVIWQALDFPDYYGCNWSAFWDCLTELYGGPIHIEIIGIGVIEEKFGDCAEKMVKILQNRIRALDIEHKYSNAGERVTVSQGVFHRIPINGNKPWDFLHCADLALYGVKRRSKNNYYIGTSLKEVREYSNAEGI